MKITIKPNKPKNFKVPKKVSNYLKNNWTYLLNAPLDSIDLFNLRHNEELNEDDIVRITKGWQDSKWITYKSDYSLNKIYHSYDKKNKIYTIYKITSIWQFLKKHLFELDPSLDSLFSYEFYKTSKFTNRLKDYDTVYLCDLVILNVANSWEELSKYKQVHYLSQNIEKEKKELIKLKKDLKNII
jgi:hypothetical protein